MNATAELACNSARQLRMHMAALLNWDCLAEVFEVLWRWAAQIALPVVSECNERERMRSIACSGGQMPRVARSSVGWSSA